MLSDGGKRRDARMLCRFRYRRFSVRRGGREGSAEEKGEEESRCERENERGKEGREEGDRRRGDVAALLAAGCHGAFGFGSVPGGPVRILATVSRVKGQRRPRFSCPVSYRTLLVRYSTCDILRSVLHDRFFESDLWARSGQIISLVRDFVRITGPGSARFERRKSDLRQGHPREKRRYSSPPWLSM